MGPNWAKVSDERYDRADGASVAHKFSGTWSWAPPGGRPPAGQRGKATAEDAMRAADEEWPPAPTASPPAPDWSPEDARTAWPVSELAARAHRRQADEEMRREVMRQLAGPIPPPVSEPSPSFLARDREREERERQREIVDRLIGRASPDELAAIVGPPPSSWLAPAPPPRAAPSGSADVLSPLPAPIAVLPPSSRRIGPTTLGPPTPAPLTARSPHTAPPSEVPTMRPGMPPISMPTEESTPEVALLAKTGTYKEAVANCGNAMIRTALAKHPHNKSAAARELGLTREGLYGALRRMGWSAPPEISARARASGVVGARERHRPTP